MNGNVGFGLFHAVLISLYLFPLFTTPTLITEFKLKSAGKSHSRQSEYMVCDSDECEKAAMILRNSMNTRNNPCDDFYLYACGNWPRNLELDKYPKKYQTSTIDVMNIGDIENDDEIGAFLEQKNSPDEPESVHKARQLYSTCVDRKSFQGIELLKETLKSLDIPYFPKMYSRNEKFDQTAAIAKMTKMTGIGFFIPLVGVHPQNHSVNAIWLFKRTNFDNAGSPFLVPVAEGKKKTKESLSRRSRSDEEEFIFRIKTKCSHPDSTVEIENFKQITDLDLIIGKTSFTLNSPSFIPTVCSLQELQSMSDCIVDKQSSTMAKFNWTRYFEVIFNGTGNSALNLTNPSLVKIVIPDIDGIRKMIEILYKKTHERSWEPFLWCNIVHPLLPYASYDFFREKFNITSTSAQKRTCNIIAARSFGMAISYMYTKKEEYRKAKIEVEKMFSYIKESFRTMLNDSDWMSSATKSTAVKKLDKMKIQIGYPDSTELIRISKETYGKINISNNILASMMSTVRSKYIVNLKKLNKINDLAKESWMVPPTTMNAYYLPLQNSISIPAALLKLPFANGNLKSLIYGSIGSIVGHEISHGFDRNTGRKYNEDGIVFDWFDAKSNTRYEEKSKCFAKAYNKLEPEFQGIPQKGNSTLTLDEDISDNAGFKAALLAYRNYVKQNGAELLLDNFQHLTSEQIFTLAYANLWCESPTKSITNIAPTLRHSPNAVRVNGVMMNSNDFIRIWKCDIDTYMNSLNPKCSIFGK